MAGASGWDDVEEWASHHRATLALSRVLPAIDFTELSACVQEWATGIPPGCSPGAADLDIEADH